MDVRADTAQRRLDRLREHRVYRGADRSMKFLKGWFNRSVAVPHRQIGKASAAWEDMVPDAILKHTRLISLQRGVLRVEVDSSAILYELDALNRTGLEQALQRSGTGVRKVKLVLGSKQSKTP